MENERRVRRGWPANALCIAGAILAVTSCSSTKASSGTTTGSAKPKAGGSVVVACATDTVSSFDPTLASAGACDFTAYSLVYDQLVHLDAEGNVSPGLATSWSFSSDLTQLTMNLRAGVKFQDGTIFDASAVKFNIDRLRAPKVVGWGSSYLTDVASVDVVSPSQVRIDLKQPDAAFLAFLSNPMVGSIASPAAVSKSGASGFAAHPVGTGPFSVASIASGGSDVHFAKFASYWGKSTGGQQLPYLDTVELKGVSDSTVRLVNLQSGQFTMVDALASKDVAAVKKDSALQAVTTPTWTPIQLGLNPNVAPFNNQQVREAVAMAIDRSATIKNVSAGLGVTRPLIFAPGTWFDVTKPDFTYDPQKAKQLLNSAGIPNGFTATVSIINRPLDTQVAQLIQADLAKIGVTLKISSVERTQWVAANKGHRSQAVILEGLATPEDPSFIFGTQLGSGSANWVGWNSGSFLQLQQLNQQALATTDHAARLKLYQQVQQVAVDQAVYVNVGLIPTVNAASSKISGMQVGADGQWILTDASLR